MAAALTHLPPLKGYLSSVAVETNEAGDVVGFSMGTRPGASPVQATLWQHENPDKPLSLSTAESSVAFRINNKGEILIAEDPQVPYVHGGFQWTPATAYWLWRGNQPPVHLAGSGDEAVDLNDTDQVLIRLSNGTAAIRNPITGDLTHLPPPPPDIIEKNQRHYLGIDGDGRVALWLHQSGSGPGWIGIGTQAWRLDPGGSQWVIVWPPDPQYYGAWLQLENIGYPPRLTRAGLLLANHEYWDLKYPGDPKTIPAVKGSHKKIRIYRNSNPIGYRIVGFEAEDDYAAEHPFLWKNPVASYYNKGDGAATSLAPDLPGMDSSIAVAATSDGLIVGNGVMKERVQAWTLRPEKDLQDRISDWREIHPLARAAPRVFLTLTLPDPPDWEFLLAQAREDIRGMNPRERKEAIDALADFTARNELIARALRQALNE